MNGGGILRYIKVYYSANIFILAFISFLIFRPIEGQINSIKTYNYNDYTRVSGITYEASSSVRPDEPSSIETSSYEGLTGSLKQVIDFVYSKIGHPYIWGGIGQEFQGVESGWSWRETSCTESSKIGMDGYDCSGLCYCAYKTVTDEEFPRSTYAMLAVAGYSTYPGDDQLKPGDLLFPSTGHVVMYTGNNKFVEAPRRGTIIREGDLNERNWVYWWRPMP